MHRAKNIKLRRYIVGVSTETFQDSDLGNAMQWAGLDYMLWQSLVTTSCYERGGVARHTCSRPLLLPCYQEFSTSYTPRRVGQLEWHGQSLGGEGAPTSIPNHLQSLGLELRFGASPRSRHCQFGYLAYLDCRKCQILGLQRREDRRSWGQR